MSLGETRSYNPLNSIFTFFGFPFEDFADGTWIYFTFPNKIWNSLTGADGTNFRTLNLQGFNCNCELTLKQGSKSNQIMQGLLDADITTNAPGKLFFKDLDSNTIISALNCYIDAFAPTSRESGAQTNVVWPIYIPRAIVNLAGYSN